MIQIRCSYVSGIHGTYFQFAVMEHRGQAITEELVMMEANF
jgi:hypothetical protein